MSASSDLDSIVASVWSIRFSLDTMNRNQGSTILVSASVPPASTRPCDAAASVVDRQILGGAPAVRIRAAARGFAAIAASISARVRLLPVWNIVTCVPSTMASPASGCPTS